MPDPAAAEEHLRVIRSLMERSTIYRALSAPAALIGGLLSLGTALPLLIITREKEISSTAFAIAWFAVFFLTVTASVWLLSRDAARRGEVFLSAGARSALNAMLPPVLVGGVYSAVAVLRDGLAQSLPPSWMICYGLSLLAMGHFAPRSIRRLGWSFLVVGLIVATGIFDDWIEPVVPPPHTTRLAALSMAATFGLFHLIYAACTWPRGLRQKESGVASRADVQL